MSQLIKCHAWWVVLVREPVLKSFEVVCWAPWKGGDG